MLWIGTETKGKEDEKFLRSPIDSLHCRGSRGFHQSAAAQARIASVPSSLTPTNAGSSDVNGDQLSLLGTVRQPDLSPVLTLQEKPNELRLGR